VNTNSIFSRRSLLHRFGAGSAVLPFLSNLPIFANSNKDIPKQRLIIIFSPDGVVKKNFWPASGPLRTPGPVQVKTELPEILQPFEPFRNQLITLKGISNKVRGDGDGHMRGIGCLLTGIELLPGNIQGGSHTPAGWASGLSIDQEIAGFLQSTPATSTRFGSLEFGVLVPNRADTWSRMVYAGSNQPIPPIDDPYRMFQKLYGNTKDQENLKSVLDDLQADLKQVARSLPAEDRNILEKHTTFVEEFEKELSSSYDVDSHMIPSLEEGIVDQNDDMPKISRMQIELLVSSLAADFARVITLQYTGSVGQPRFKWLGIDEGQHGLSHKPNSDKDAQEKLTQINTWYANEIAHLAKRLAETPEPYGNGSLLDNTTIVWTNELGEGNSHSHADIPFVMLGGGLGFKGGRALQFSDVPHNRLLLSIAHAMGHTKIDTFGSPDFCADGPLTGLT
jgi:hypothetical protein